MGLVKRIYKALFGPKTEIEKVEAALRRYRDEYDDMTREFWRAGGGCCPDCAYGSRYFNLGEKIHRVDAWLKILKARKNKR